MCLAASANNHSQTLICAAEGHPQFDEAKASIIQTELSDDNRLTTLAGSAGFMPV